MGLVEVGRAGGSAGEGAGRYGAAAAARGRFFERQVALAPRAWLERRRDQLHLFHDLGGFTNLSGHGLCAVTLRGTNIDHVVLSGSAWPMVDARGCGAGTLTVDTTGHGVLSKPDGTLTPQPWMDNVQSYASSGALVRLTGKRGLPVWVIPDATSYGQRVAQARCFSGGGILATLSEVASGELDELLPPPQPPASAEDVAALTAHTRRHVGGVGHDVPHRFPTVGAVWASQTGSPT